MSNNIVQFNEEIFKGQIKELVRGSVEETLNELLEAEAQKLTQAARYERSEARQGYRSGVVSSIMRKIVLALAEIHYRGRFAAPWFSSSGQGAKGQGRRYAACLALDALQPDCYQPTAWSCSRASRCFIFMYFLQPHWVPVT